MEQMTDSPVSYIEIDFSKKLESMLNFMATHGLSDYFE
jgi:hypothetical protein